jgi:dipeptidyl aminopeptidase/acylaminoacyl peptidase
VLAKKQLTEADYHLWGTMGGEQISDKGNWVSYRMSYENNVDTLFVVNTKTKKKYDFPAVRIGQFTGEKSFVFQRKDALVLFDLSSANEQLIPNISRYEFSTDGRFLVSLENSNTLVVRKYGKVIDNIENVTEYESNNDKTKLVYTASGNGKGTVCYLDLKDNYFRHLIVQPTKQTFQVFKWQLNGKSISFYGVDKGNEELYYYDLVLEKLHILKSSDNNFPRHMKIAPDQNVALKVSRDGKKVFFGITNAVAKDTTVLSGGVEVWNAKDQMLYRERKLLANVSHWQSLAVWLPNDGMIKQVSSEKQKWVALNGNQDYALVADLYQYEPQYKWIADMDYYLMDIKTGKSKLFLAAQSGYDDQMDFSPDGHYISYYKDSNWWVYDLIKKSHTNITKGLTVSWDNKIIDPGTELYAWGQPGWTSDGKFLVCYDYYDIWAISPDGKQRKRLTTGREKQLRFRLDDSAISNEHEFNYSDCGTTTYDLSKNVLLTVLDMYSGATGYYKLQPNAAAQPLVMGNASITKLQKAKNANAFIYVSQRFDSPPSLQLKNGVETTVLVQSNEHQKNYQWGKSEMIHYTDSKGNPLNGVLYYPANYDSAKRYPMVVFIYESLSRSIHNYVNPSLHNGIGFNVANLVTNGYAVLLPDIAYEKGNSGMSAVDCVTSAVTKVIEMGVADAVKIGLTGQSFGGYETNFIITQTNMFAAAISGSGVSDILQHYFTVNTGDNLIDGWRYENQQYRMGCSFFDNQEAFYRNSPLLNASKINTPLLTWAGKLDENVQPRQAETFYAALRRLKKEHVMLVYDNDGHIFNNPKNQEDLTRKMNDWFGYYLKGENKPEWSYPN